MKDKIFSWFATSPLSSAARVGIASALTYLIQNVSGFDFDPVVEVLIVAAATSAMRFFNPADGIFGVNATEVEEK